jgi:uncharacterized protein YukE
VTGSIDLTPEELKKQASDLREFAEHIRAANTSAASRDLYNYGAIGLVWAGALNERFSAADQFAGDAADAAERVAEQLDAMAKDFKTRDQAHASDMQQISGDLS